MKHLWIFNHYARSPGERGAARHFMLARHLRDFGWRTSIVAASTDHPSGAQRPGVSERRLESVDGVTFAWLKTRSYSGNNLGRVLNIGDYTLGALSQGNLARLDPPDAVIGSSVHPLAAWAAARAAKRRGVPFLFEVRDLWPRVLIDTGRISAGHPAALLLGALERHLCRRAARILPVMPGAVEHFESIGIDRDKVLWLPHGVDLDAFPAYERRNDGPFTFMYLGAHGTTNDLETLLAAMRTVEDRVAPGRIRLRLIGEGPHKPALQALARQGGLRAVAFEDPVPNTEVPRLAAGADCFVMCMRDLPGLYRFGMSQRKMYDYMAAARPTIIAASGANNIIAEAGGGVTVAPEDPVALAEAMLAMAATPASERAAMGAAARRHIEEHYGFDELAARLAAALDRAVADGR